MTLDQARKLVGEYFKVELPEQADDILCAALRLPDNQRPFEIKGWLEHWWFTEDHIRRCLASTRALFGHTFRVE